MLAVNNSINLLVTQLCGCVPLQTRDRGRKGLPFTGRFHQMLLSFVDKCVLANISIPTNVVKNNTAAEC